MIFSKDLKETVDYLKTEQTDLIMIIKNINN